MQSLARLVVLGLIDASLPSSKDESDATGARVRLLGQGGEPVGYNREVQVRCQGMRRERLLEPAFTVCNDCGPLNRNSGARHRCAHLIDNAACYDQWFWSDSNIDSLGT